MIDTPQSPMFAIRSSLFLNITTQAVEDPTIPYRYEEALAHSMTASCPQQHKLLHAKDRDKVFPYLLLSIL